MNVLHRTRQALAPRGDCGGYAGAEIILFIVGVAAGAWAVTRTNRTT